MSIYFSLCFRELLFLALFAAIFKSSPKPLALGALFALLGFYISSVFLATAQLNLAANIILIIIIPITFFVIKYIRDLCLALISFSYFIKYFYASQDFALLSQSLLDLLAIYNIAYLLLAILILLAISYLSSYFFLNKKVYLSLAFILTFISLCISCSEIILYCMRMDVLPTHSLLLSYVAKSRYYSYFTPYILLFILLIISLAHALLARKPVKDKALDIIYRSKRARYDISIRNTTSFMIVFAMSYFVLLYYDLVESKPITLEAAEMIEPGEDLHFTFDANLAMDNKLHRFAYINDNGKEIRFFIINKFKDQVSPVAVFDTCSICGDMGYIKRGEELICVACNVRIFLPSVGKNGGCNPTPFNFQIKDGKLKIPLKEIEAGENYFSKIIEVVVINPVNGNKFKNTDAKKQYKFKGKTYYFDDEKSFELFHKDPARYVGSETKAYFKTNAKEAGRL